MTGGHLIRGMHERVRIVYGWCQRILLVDFGVGSVLVRYVPWLLAQEQIQNLFLVSYLIVQKPICESGKSHKRPRNIHLSEIVTLLPD